MKRFVHYIDMTKAKSEEAFQEFLGERGPALQRLREALLADGQDPDALLDGSIESFIPLWRWILSRLAGADAPGATAPGSVPRDVWPSWERYMYEGETTLSLESLFLLDGLVSYLAAVVQERAPQARWEIARHHAKNYRFRNHPVMVRGTAEGHMFLPRLPVVASVDALRGARESPDDEIADYARALIEQLNRGDSPEDEPLVEVEDLGDDEIRGRELEVSLREDIGHEHSRVRTGSGIREDEPLVEVADLGEDTLRGRELEVSLREDIGHEHSPVVDRMVKALKWEDGISRVIREDREVLLVATASWSIERLQAWVAGYLEENVRD
ncbi:hypothetical protein [Pseudarthrobacter sp. NS4]|uniref:hypothetical protein n=1 Tax=Pseudarthrobacter sp. NS4 TaxID=2973976 RepID=UPI002161B071|nr:hypothetical protein [Pseudarthrobacter sp. NS4]